MTQRFCTLLVSLFFISWVSQAQPAFNTLVVNSANTQATVTFSVPVAGNVALTQNLAPADFTVTISASANGGTVAAGPVTVTVTHTAPSATATLGFTIPNASTADGSEILTVKASSATSIYNGPGGSEHMTGLETITANLKDLKAPVIVSINRLTPATSLTNLATLIFQVTYSESVTGVAAANFNAFLTDATAGTITTITGSGTTYNVTVPTVAIATVGVDGVVRLDADDVPAVKDAALNSFVGSKTGDQTYTVDQTPPAAPSVPDLDDASDSNINSDNVTNDNTPTFTVTGTNGLLLEILDGASVVASITSNGAAQQLTTSALADGGNKSITARTTDAAGNTTSSTALLVTIDTGIPPAPSIPDLTTDSGSSATDNITNDNTPDFSVSAGSGLKLEIIVDATTVVASTASATGTLQTLTASTLSDASYSVTARATDLAGNSASSTALNPVTIDTAPPGTTPTVPNLQAGSDLGASSTDDFTADNTPTFSVTGTNTLTLELLDGSTVVNTITSNGTSQPMTSSVLSDGLHNISARTSDVAGNSVTSVALPITIETDPPAIVSITPIQSISRGILLKTGTISASNADTDVTGNPGTLFLSELYVGAVLVQTNGTVIGTVASITSNTALVLTGNAANNLVNQPFANQFYFTATFDEPMSSTSVTTADFSETGTGDIGTVEPASAGNPTSFYIHVISLLGDNGTTRIDLGNNGYQDVAGNNVTVTLNGTAATIDNTAPAFSAQTPATNAFVNTSKVGYTITEANGPLPTATVTWTQTGGTMDPYPTHTIPLTAAERASGVHANATLTNDTINLKNGSIYTVSFSGTDAAGNVSTTLTSTSVTNDEAAPSDFTTGLVASTGGTVATGYWNSTNTNLTVVIPIEAADVSLTNGSVQIQWAKSSAPGAFNNITGSGVSTITGAEVTAGTKTVTITAANLESVGFLAAPGETITIRAIITDRVGNTKTGANSGTTFVQDQTVSAPSVPDLDAADDTGLNTDNITKNTAGLTFTGTSEPGATVQLRNNTTAIGSVVADGSGNWSITVTIAAGTHPINARQTDAAGNPQSGASANLSVTVDTTVPVFTATAPATNAFVNHKKVSYTLSSAIASGTITWTRTGGSTDPTPHVQTLTGSELNTGAHTDITLSSSPPLVDGAVYEITFNANDVADNAAVAVINTGVTYDITPPTIISASFTASLQSASSSNPPPNDLLYTSCNGTVPNDGTQREFVHLTFSEPLNITNGQTPTMQTASTGTIGFNAANYVTTNGTVTFTGANYQTFDNACDARGGTVYHPTNVIHLQSQFMGSTSSPNNSYDGLWTNATTFSFVAGGTNVRDLAGNEMVSVPVISTTATAPLLASSMVLDPDPSGPGSFEKITFVVDQTLTTSQVANAVTGITVDADGPGGAAGVVRPGTYSASGNTVTVTSTADNQWSSVTTVSYASGTGTPLTTTVAMASFGPERVLLGPVAITSSNTPNTLAKEGNTIFVTFTVNPGSLPLSGTPFSAATIGGIDVLSSLTGANPYTFSLVTSVATPVPETSVAFSITAEQSGRTTTITKSIPGTTVTYDKTKPANPAAPVLASADDSGTSPSDAITKNNTDLTFSGTIDNSSTISLGATVNLYNGATLIGTTTATPGTGAWSIEAYPSPATIADGTHSITVQVIDAAGNAAVSASPALTLVIDNAVSPPSGFDLAALDDVGFSPSDNITKNTSALTITGTSENFAAIEIWEGATQLATTPVTITANGSGTWTADIALAEGVHAITARQTDRAGNLSAVNGTPLSITIDTSAPTASAIPDLNSADDTGLSNSDYLTKNLSGLTFSSAPVELSAYVQIFNDGAGLGTVYGIQANGTTGNWSGDIALTEGDHDITTIVTDAAGNASAPSTIRTITIDATAPTITRTIASNGANPVYAKVGDQVTVTFTSTEQIVSTGAFAPAGTIDASAMSFTLLNSINLPFPPFVKGTGTITTTSSNNNGTMPFSVSISDAAGNTTTSTTVSSGPSVTFDKTPPSVQSISIINTPTNSWSSTNGTSSNTVQFNVTFNEDLKNISTAEFNAFKGPGDDVNVAGASVASTTTSNSVIVTGSSISGTGEFRIEYNDLDIATDLAGNPVGGVGTTGSFPTSFANISQYYTIVKPQPSVSVTGFGQSTAATSVTVTWNDAFLPANQATHYFVRLKRSTSAFSPVTFTEGIPAGAANDDGENYTDTDFSDGTLAAYVPYESVLPTGTHTFTGVASGTAYNIEIYPVAFTSNYGADNWDYKFTSPLTGNATTTTSPSSSVALGAIPPTSFSSVATALAGAVVPQANAVQNFAFTIQDDGSTPNADNAPFKFTTIVIQEGTGSSNSIADWTLAIDSARLTDGTTTVDVGNAAVLTSPNRIVFNVSSANLGLIADNGFKTYTLKIALKTSLGGTLPLNIDGKNFEFMINGSSFTYDNTGQTSSTLLASGVSSTAETGDANNQVSVSASAIAFTTQPSPTTVLVLTNFVTPPIAKAVDANSNVDLGFTSPSVPTVTITNTGTLGMSTSSIVPVSGVISFPTNFQYQGAGNGRLTLTGGGINSNSGAGFVQCTPVTVQYSSTSVITNNTLANAIESHKVTQATADAVFRFNVIDDGGSGGDGAPTKISQIVIAQGPVNGSPPPTTIVAWKDVILGAVLTDNATPTANSYHLDSAAFALAATNSTITFSGIPNTLTTDMGYIGNDQTKIYTLSIYLKKAQVNPTTIDGSNLVFQVVNTNLFVPAASSQISVTGTNSGSTNNVIDVQATKLAFITQPASTLLVSKAISLQLPIPSLQATDAYGNRDLGYSTNLNITNEGPIQMSTATPPQGPATSILQTGTNGLYTFPGDFMYNQIGNGRLVATPSSGTVAFARSNPVTVEVATSTRINSPGISAATLTSITNIAPGSTVFTFSIKDDDGAENDGNPTLITELLFTPSTLNNTVADWSQAIAGARVEDSADPTKFIDILPANILNNSLNFTGISTAVGALGRITDDATKTYNLRIWLKTNLSGANDYPNTIDGLKFGFDIASGNVTTDPNGTALLSGLNSNTNNVTTTVAVVASELHITTPASASFASLSSPFSVTVQARDINLNLDLDFEAGTGIITSVTNATSATMVGTGGIAIGTAGSGITFNTTSFTNGIFTFPAAFQFITGNNNDNVTLDINAGGISTVDVVPGPAPFTPLITLQTSSESAVVGDPTFAFTTDIPYHNYPEATDLTNANNYALGRLLLVDGSRTAFTYSSTFGSGTLTTNTNNDGLPSIDSDGASTNLNSLTLRITNPANIRRIALFTNGGTEIGTEIPVNELKSVAFKDFTFSGSPLLTTLDDTQSEIRIGVSFWNDSTHVTDNKLIQVSIVGAILGNGSKFFPEPANPAYIAGVDGGVAGVTDVGYAAPTSVNRIEVTATSLDFVKQPNDFAGINQPINAATASSTPYTAIVHARDKFAVVDLDFNYTPSVTASANPISSSTPFVFVNGVLDLKDLQYNNAGAGKLTVSTSSPNPVLNSNNTPWTTSIVGEQVDVINVTATENTNGVLTTPNLKGGNVNQVIFGFTLNAQHKTASEPKLKTFSITFKDDNGLPYFYKTGSATVLKNFKILESTQGTAAGATSIAGIATITQARSPKAISLYGASATNFDMVTVTFNPSSNYRTLFDPANPLTYYLQVDVDVSTNIGTPAITPYLEDNGFADALTRDNVILTEGSSKISPAVKGATRSFASTKPPALVSSSPFNGQLNVDTLINTITLFFDVPVTTFDGKAYLYDRYSNTLVATLTATNGNYQWSTGQPISPSPYITNPLTFALPPTFDLKPDSVYYLTINQGRFDPNNPVDRAGISDDGFNLFGGISFNGTLYFKAASKKAPVMKGTDPLKYYFSNTTATINASFNQRGKAHFMITSTGATAPTNAQIKGAAYSGGTVVGRDSFNIAQIEPSYQYGTLNVGLTPGVTYDVFMYAENDALPKAIATTAPYGSAANGFAAGNTGPTIRFTVPAATTSLTNFPRYQICSNSYTQLTDPIIISEVSNNQFSGGAGVIQTVNLLLPTGFQFDVNADTVIVEFNGGDFDNTLFNPALSNPLVHYEFINTTILKISFVNNGSGSFDNIIISDLSVIASSPDITGFIKRFSGNGIPSIGDGYDFAQITSASDDPINFTNSYSNVGDFDQAPISIANTVTYIPDNYVDVNLNQSATRLFPLPPSGDYGPTSFSGSGLTNDILNLTAVPLNTGFNISLSHTDMNGCISTKSDQYTVYNHKNAIASLGTPSIVTGERQVCITNQNFPAASTNPLILADSVSVDGLAGYKLIQLFANIPTKATATSQIIYGPAWQALVQQLPVEYSAKFDANTGQTYRTYNWDYNRVLNANPLSVGTLVNPYSNFIRPTTPLSKTYYQGGSLGIIEFTGKYHSKADFSVFIPVRQEVEVFIPALPVVEQVTAASYTTSTGTLVYCEGIGSTSDILMSGYPAASPGSSTGFFTLRDSASLALVTIPTNGFTDNGNGTSLLKSSVTNNYKTIRVEYTYQDIGSPCSATGSFFIRITPNPIANFSANSVMASRNPIKDGRPSAPNAYCEDNLIQFDNTSTFPVGASGYVANTNPQWTLGDPLSATNAQITPSAFFTYNTYGKYDVTFSVESQYRCKSNVATTPIYVGVTPTPSFKMDGISTATQINVRSTTSISSGASFPKSDTLQSVWNFNSGLTAPSALNYTNSNDTTYAAPGHYVVTLKAVTTITGFSGDSPRPGCEITFQRPLIIVPAVSAAAVGVESLDDFESSDPMKQWQESSTNNSISSWERGDATIESSTTDLPTNVWASGLSTSYNPGEVSFLYSPSYDISNLVRPKVSFDHVAYMDVNDGVVLEFSTDNYNITDPLKKWYRIGTNVDGNNWYNRSGLASKPGTQVNVVTGISSGDYGWSAQLDTVLHSQHTISPDIPAGQRTQVIFRFALASLSGSSSQGFAFDNFRVGERTRVVLVENFTNAGNSQLVNGVNLEYRESEFLKGSNFTGVGTDVIKINYHVGFPNLDPFNDDYPADPSARALYYNISETPLARLDGGQPSDPQKKYFSDWGVAMYNIRTLKLAGAELQITTPTISSTGEYEFNVTVTAKSRLAEEVTILHIAFVEATPQLDDADQDLVVTGETTFEYVLKEMVPSALGTRFSVELLAGQSKTFGPFKWTPDLGKLHDGANDMAIVAFLQNEVTKEVYQTEILTGITDPTLVTAVEDPDYAAKVQLFPNPANNEINIQLPIAVNKSTPIEMFDTNGKNVYQSSFNAGEQIKTISTGELIGGVYLIQFHSPNGDIVRRKIMVVHR